MEYPPLFLNQAIRLSEYCYIFKVRKSMQIKYLA